MKSNFYTAKIHNYHLVKVLKNDFTLYFIIIFLGIFSHYKKIGVEFNMNYSIY
jgi:hypothetical protein